MSRTPKTLLKVGTASLFGGLLCAGLLISPAQAEEESNEPPEEPSDGIDSEMRSDSVEEFNAPDYVQQYDPEDHIEYLGGSESEEEEVIVLEADILFEPMEWDLPGSANSVIAELVEEIPEGAEVDVHGHTDSNPVPDGYDFDNQVLSENRAEAVAEILESERPDLTLNVEGFGEEQPAVEEDPGDLSTYAANRRVEIRYD